MINQLQHLLEKEKRCAVGLMSGTSLDGIDAALVEIEGSGTKTNVNLLALDTLNFNVDERNRILALCAPETSRVNDICHMNVHLGEKMAEAALKVIHKAGMLPEQVDFISSHGQTIYHMPDDYATLQIGELAVIAARTGILTVGDFRPHDMAVGGQGAPLVPYVDYLLFSHDVKGRAMINIGGISNISILKPQAKADDVIAFDMGPGNMLIDAIMTIGTEDACTYDPNGEYASRGKVYTDWLKAILKRDTYLAKEPPKSTGRESYTYAMAKALYEEGISLGLAFDDIVATVTAYTTESIIGHFKQFIDPTYNIEEVIISGGGVHNKTIMKGLAQGLKQQVLSMDDWGFSSDGKEAIAFAVLGNECIHGHTNTLPSATGAKKAVSMGKLVLP
ncbi:anhydro-N-acetylmuramic acid kinase [Vallitalea pronyensis]|uniref:Anhydro-N-acetylmuramic acid kinase n=2 Tax=Vallitalea pronyensis TaxID=1348613 RepID=A0A8J8MQQ7_9FIRM|nr:anhydro-N-acetylmuramic acid kinase [Vallitalea pronyensis]